MLPIFYYVTKNNGTIINEYATETAVKYGDIKYNTYKIS